MRWNRFGMWAICAETAPVFVADLRACRPIDQTVHYSFSNPNQKAVLTMVVWFHAFLHLFNPRCDHTVPNCSTVPSCSNGRCNQSPANVRHNQSPAGVSHDQHLRQTRHAQISPSVNCFEGYSTTLNSYAPRAGNHQQPQQQAQRVSLTPNPPHYQNSWPQPQCWIYQLFVSVSDFGYVHVPNLLCLFCYTAAPLQH